MTDGSSSDNDQLDGASTSLEKWEQLATEAVGDVIEFWGFKHNHGRVWALLFIRGATMTSRQLKETLGLSKGAVSMLTNDLRDWGIVDRSRPPNSRAVHYGAKNSFLDMVRHVVRERELSMVEDVRATLDDAIVAADEADVDEFHRDRLQKMYRLATMIEQTIELFLSTARFDITDAGDVLATDDKQ